MNYYLFSASLIGLFAALAACFTEYSALKLNKGSKASPWLAGGSVVAWCVVEAYAVSINPGWYLPTILMGIMTGLIAVVFLKETQRRQQLFNYIFPLKLLAFSVSALPIVVAPPYVPIGIPGIFFGLITVRASMVYATLLASRYKRLITN